MGIPYLATGTCTVLHFALVYHIENKDQFLPHPFPSLRVHTRTLLTNVQYVYMWIIQPSTTSAKQYMSLCIQLANNTLAVFCEQVIC